MVRIYTCGGDEGDTSLGSGARVSKTHPQICAVGDVDELNAVLGLAATTSGASQYVEALHQIQGDLLALGASLSAIDDDLAKPHITSSRVEGLESLIDQIDGDLPPLNRFVLPGGTRAGATLQWARSVARRAERSVVELSLPAEGRNEQSLRYLNRLSDLLFVMARSVNDGAEVEWRPEDDSLGV